MSEDGRPINLDKDSNHKKTEEINKKKDKKYDSMSIMKLFLSWGCFKNVGQVGMGAGNRLRLTGTGYVMHIPPKIEHTWQVIWTKSGFTNINAAKRVKEERAVSLKEVIDNIPDNLRKKFEENIELFIVPKHKK